MNSYKMMKVFDCQWDPGMPKDVKKAFFDWNTGDARNGDVGNDVYVEWTVQNDDADYYVDQNEYAIKRRLVDDWLIENGAIGRTAESPYEGETVIIKHWW